MGFITSHLPTYSGPYEVGHYDVEVSLSKPRSFGTTLSTSLEGIDSNSTTPPLEHAFTIDTVLFALFYPCQRPALRKDKVRPYWLDRPLKNITNGYLKFANYSVKPVFSFFFVLVNWIIGATLVLPAWIAASLLDPAHPPTPAIVESESSEKLEQDPLFDSNASETDEGKLPLVIFSHGLAGNRHVYSQYCGELASRGYVVAAVEHRDGTAPVTIVLNRDGSERKKIFWRPYDSFSWHDECQVDEGGKDGKAKLTNLQVRNEQLLMRKEEVLQTLEIIRDYVEPSAFTSDEREYKDGLPKNLRESSQLPFDWSAWKGRVDTRIGDVVMTGHSFGGATAIQCLKDDGLSRWFKRGILLDPWLDPIGAGIVDPDPEEEAGAEEDADEGNVDIEEAEGNGKYEVANTKTTSNQNGYPRMRGFSKSSIYSSEKTVKVPVLIQNSEAFTRWTEHYLRVKKFAQVVQSRARVGDGTSYFMTICGTIHPSFSDFPLLFSGWFIRLFYHYRKETKTPKQDMDTIVGASLEFLGYHDGNYRLEKEILGMDLSPDVLPEVEVKPIQDERIGKPGQVVMHYKG